MSILAIAIILFEFAYGKDDDKTALYGVEMLFVAIMSLVLLYTCILHKDKFIAVANIVACIGVLYYLVKSISIYIREKLKWKKTISDVKEIVAERIVKIKHNYNSKLYAEGGMLQTMKSMTGFGRASLESNGKNYIIEIKTVNNKYSDITVKSPKRLSFMEDRIRKQIANRITRGKVEVSVSFFDFSNKSKNVVLNKEIAKEYIKQLKEIADENNLSENISVVEIAKLPDILNSIDSDNDEEITSEALQCLNMALDSLIEMRKTEGENIKQDLLVRIERVQNLVDKIAENSKGIVEEYVSKLEKRVKEILKTDVVDENRIAQEAVIYADKTSIEEELTRLNSHIVQFKELVNSDGPVGKKLDFMIQEMNRETNTIGSKAGSGEITKAVIDLKVELEDIREQIQNIE